MKISTKGRYTLEAVVDLAYHSELALESLKNVADRLSISKNYLEQQFVLLRKIGIVESVRGPQGGYKLAKLPSEITVGEILRAVEGNLSPVTCAETGECNQPCGDYNLCVTKTVWQNMMLEINKVVDGITIEDLVKAYKDQQTMDVIEYFI